MNNQIGVHAGVWIGSWTPESTRTAVDQTVAAGYDLIEITATDVVFHALRTIGYGGPITFESFSTAVVDPALSNTLAVWRNLWDDNAVVDDGQRHAPLKRRRGPPTAAARPSARGGAAAPPRDGAGGAPAGWPPIR